ncbi:MAG: hypothetical protein D3918_02090 [Candidatus Electrothrix sp. AX2]|nr:hypothetical protein [Candidatus Electrothrix gigas]
MFDRRDIVEDELFLIRDSGELPEITYHSSLYYLTTDKDGPGLILTQDEQELLQAAALERCQQIILRDLLPENRNLSLYRGLRRSIFNWQRYCKCCQRMGRQIDEAFRDRVAHALAEFIQQEMIDVHEKGQTSSVNCPTEELLFFAEQVGMCRDSLALGWQTLCPAAALEGKEIFL